MLSEVEKQRIMALDLGPEPPRVGPKVLARATAEVVQWPKPLSDMELGRRRVIIEACWERTKAARQELEAIRTFHRGPGDPDWVA